MSRSEFGEESETRSHPGYIPIKYKELTYYVPIEYINEQVLEGIYVMLLRYCDESLERELGIIRNEWDRQMSIIESKIKGKHNIIGISLLTILFSVSILLSALCFLMFGYPEMGLLFLYGAVTSIGGMIFIWYKDSKEKKNNE